MTDSSDPKRQNGPKGAPTDSYETEVVDYDPFDQGPEVEAVDYDPFTSEAAPSAEAVDYDPFAADARPVDRPFATVTLAASPVNDAGEFPTTEAQKEVWASVQMGSDANLAYNEAVALRLEGRMPADGTARIESAARELIRRHQALRTTFSDDGTRMIIAPAAAADAFRLESRRVTREEADRLMRAEVETVFDLSQGPLFRLKLVSVSDSEHFLVFTGHHIVCDGWSLGILLKELGEIYSKGSAHLAKPDLFTDYVAEELERDRNGETARAEEYWAAQYKQGAPALDLPAERVRPSMRSYRADRVDWPIDPAIYQGFRKAGARAGCSFVATLLAAFDVLMYRISGQDEFVVGLPAAGQSALGRKRLAGHCVNLLPLKARVDASKPFVEYLKSVRARLLDASDHQLYTFGSLLKRLPIDRDPSRPPLASVMFNVDRQEPVEMPVFAGFTSDFLTTPRPFENFEFFVNAVEKPGEKPGSLTLLCQYNTDLFDRTSIEGWMRALETLMRAVVRSPSTAIGDLEILGAEERRRILVDLNAAVETIPPGLVHERVLQSAERNPQRVAIETEEGPVTYVQLELRSRAIAARLRDLGVRRDERVGLCVERGAGMLIGMIGALRAGGAYIPMDPAYPEDRLKHMIADAGARVLLTQRDLKDLAERLAPAGTRVLAIEEVLSASDSVIAAARIAPFGPGEAPDRDSLAYVIYTSGSTGKPKGVQLEHGSMINFLDSMLRVPGIASDEKLLAVTTMSFDIAVLELYAPLLAGATTVIAPAEVIADGEALLQLLKDSRATMMQATPATWRLLLGSGWDGSTTSAKRPKLKALCGGEALPKDLKEELLKRGVELWNMYGPTETTVWSTCGRMIAGDAMIDVGRPIANTSIYVLDSRMKPVPTGVAGELYIGGLGLARGYRNRDELTREKFVRDPFRGEVPVAAERMYHTGDRARLLSDGRLQILGRGDDQVKLRGFRIELGEIEAVLHEHPSIKQAVTMVREDRPGDQRLVAYLVPKGSLPATAELRSHLRAKVPEYMVPQHFVEIAAIPLTANGKVNRRALPAPDAGAPVSADSEAYVAPSNPTEVKVAAIWEDVLGRKQISIHANFFQLGGHSLLSIRILSRIKRDFGVALTLRDLFAAPTIAGMTERMKAASGADVVERIPARADRSQAPLSLMQRRVWYLENLNPGTTVFNLPAAFRLKGSLDVDRLRRCIDAIVVRHDALRTTFAVSDSVEDGVIQRIRAARPGAEVTLPVTDLSGLSGQERETGVRRLLHLEAEAVIDLTDEPLFRTRLYRLADEDHVLFWMPHHAVWDGWSFDVFLRELDLTYAAAMRGEPSPLPALPIQYGDFCAWNRVRTAERDLRYWRERLAGELPALGMPTDFERPEQFTYRGDTVPFELGEELVRGLTEAARAGGATLFMLLLTAFKVMLHRYTGQTDILVGTPIQGRNRPETEDLVGFFVNTLVLRTDLSSRDGRAPGFSELLQRVRETALDAFSHQELPFELLVEELGRPRDMSRTPIYQAFFTYQDVSNRRDGIGELALSQINIHSAATPTDLSLWVKESGKGLVGSLDFSTDLFRKDSAAKFVSRYVEFLRIVASKPEIEVRADLAGAEPSAIDASSGASSPSGAAPGAAGGKAAPRTPGEEILVRIWKEVLGTEAIGIHDNFFDVGGHSLLSMKVIARVRAETGVRLSPRLLLLNTLEQIAPEIDGLGAASRQAPGGVPAEAPARAQAEVAKAVARPRFFGDAKSPLYGVYAPAAPAADRREGVLLCYPLSKEYMRAHWSFRRLAERLSAAGFHVLRFDWSCTGDSAGEGDEAAWERWISDVSTAARELRALSGARRISIVGLRAGAALALEGASAAGADHVVLWDPVSDGALYLDELRAARSLPAFDHGAGVLARLRSYSLAETAPRVDRATVIHTHDDPRYEMLERSLATMCPRVRRELVADANGWADPASWEARLMVGPVLDSIVRELGGGA